MPAMRLLICLLATTLTLTVAPSQAQGASPADIQIQLNAWVHDPVLSSVALSPDGKHLVAVSLPDVTGTPSIAVWDADALAAAPKRFDLTAADGSRWKPVGASWLNDHAVYVIGLQNMDFAVGARKIKTFRQKAFVYDLRKGELLEPFGGGGSRIESLFGQISLLDRLPNDPDRVLVRIANFEGAGDIYEMDLDKYRVKRIFKAASGSQAFTDLEGNVRGRIQTEGSGDTARIEVEARKAGSDSWGRIATFFARDREGLQPAGFGLDPDIFYMTDTKGREHAVIREYNLKTDELSEPIFEHRKYDATGVVLGTSRKKFGQLLGFSYAGPRSEVYWIDPDRDALHKGLKQAFPGKHISLGSFSDDETRAVVFVSDSNDPGTYYLYDANKGLIELGKPRPLLDPAKLPKTQLVNYKARDGLEVPAFLTLPLTGEKPYPLVVMPHGGPWARDQIGFDTWRQFLANRGYAVLQPQYRGSDGWGQTLWRAGDREWGQKMQDDKDDGARWLVEQGIADPERMAMYGFSYGGYAAMAAIVRPDPPWQCAIAGAGLSELRTFDRVTFEGSRFNREFQNPTIAGLSPLEQVDKASIPILIFHGDRDQTVPIDQSEKYHEALLAAGKDSTYVAISDYGHGPSITPDKQAKVLELLEGYLRDSCGPGGL
ncbi:MAG: alpha/beta hydrolase family protein [Steroidobacteraceae bacterium]